MDFELKHLDMIQAEQNMSSTSVKSKSSERTEQLFNHQHTSRSTSVDVNNKSIVLSEMTEQIEQLQNKLNISYKKLLLFEAENQKLIQEKNSLFFDSKSHQEENELLTEKNKKLTIYCQELEEENRLQSHQIETLQKLNETQKVDLNRLSKFHLKVKNIIKPHVEKLKKQIISQEHEIDQKNKVIDQLQEIKLALGEKLDRTRDEFEQFKKLTVSEKNQITQGYEEQIHFLSKEIVEHQEKVLQAQNENLRLKKLTETKHYIENELIKFKRQHDENLQLINQLKLKENDLNNRLSSFEEDNSTLKNKCTQLSTEIETLQINLEMTRKQLSSKLDQIEQLNLRLKMLEKLNTNLSLNIKEAQV